MLHKGWTATPTGRVRKNGKLAYKYFNRRLNGRTTKSLADGVSRRELPKYLEMTGHVCPMGNLWTAKSIFKTFEEVKTRLSPRYRELATSEPYRVKDPHVRRVITLERSWARKEAELHAACEQYQRDQHPRMMEAFQAMEDRLKEEEYVEEEEEDGDFWDDEDDYEKEGEGNGEEGGKGKGGEAWDGQGQDDGASSSGSRKSGSCGEGSSDEGD